MHHVPLLCAILGLLFATAHSQSPENLALLGSFPACATNCFVSIVPTTGCNVTDFECLCAHPTFGDESIACFTGDCSAKDTLRATNISTVLCDWPIRDNHNQGKISIIVLTSVAFIFVALRVIARDPFKSDLFGWDDGLIIVAFATTVPLLVLQILLTENGIGRDIWTLPFDYLTQFLKLFYVFEIWYILSTVIMKMSILFFYLRVFPRSRTTTVIKVTNCIVGFYGFAFIAIIIFQCWPISYIWTRWTNETEGKCVPTDLLWVHAGLNIILDLLVLLLPLPKLFKLQLNYSSKKKLRVILMFSVGVIVTFTSVMRLRTLAKLGYDRPNFTWDWSDCALWSGIEANTGIVCACLPAVRVFFIKTFPNWLESTTRSKSRGTYAQGSTGRNANLSAGRWTSAESKIRKQEDFVQLADFQSTKSGSEAELTGTYVADVPQGDDGYSGGEIQYHDQHPSRNRR